MYVEWMKQAHKKFLDLVAYAFQWELSEKNKERYRLLAENSWNYGSYDDQGKLASQIMATPFAIDFHGTSYPMAGIGFVASYPEYRSQEESTASCAASWKIVMSRGIVLSYLAPFSFPFYRRYGYEYVFERMVYDVAAHEWADSPKVTGSIQRLPWSEAKSVIHDIYHAMPRHKKADCCEQIGGKRSNLRIVSRIHLPFTAMKLGIIPVI